MPKPSVKPLLFDTYLAVIQNSLGTRMFRDSFALVDGKRRNITKGELSCAFYVSFILKFFDLIREPHATVGGLERDLADSGWEKIRRPRPGCLIIWAPGQESSGHRHVGFYVGHERAISNSSKNGVPVKHHWTYSTKTHQPKRKIQAMYWSESLGFPTMTKRI